MQESLRLSISEEYSPRQIESPLKRVSVPLANTSVTLNEMNLETGLYWWLVKRSGSDDKNGAPPLPNILS